MPWETILPTGSLVVSGILAAVCWLLWARQKTTKLRLDRVEELLKNANTRFADAETKLKTDQADAGFQRDLRG
jgi:hypothetical protein